MISVFDMFKIGIGPSSSHTVGPMKAGKAFVDELIEKQLLAEITDIHVDVYGSLALTGKGHHTDIAIIMGLAGNQPNDIDIASIEPFIEQVKHTGQLLLAKGQKQVNFPLASHLLFHDENLPLHENGLTIKALIGTTICYQKTYYSVGGGFIVDEQHFGQSVLNTVQVPYPFHSAEQLLDHCQQQQASIEQIVLQNELTQHSQIEINDYFSHVWQTMQDCIQAGLSNEGPLPGPLQVPRRAAALQRLLLQSANTSHDPMDVIDWVNMFALAVNEENAAGGRVVTAPTNGACGIVPAVLAYYDKFIAPVTLPIFLRYFLTSGAIGILYKMNASISGAEVGCQGEVGVACSMAAAGLAALLNATPGQVCIAAEIGMEHNLGLTCDPVAGQVQIPCIERNAIASVKAINAARMAIHRTSRPCVSLDKVIETMYETGKDINAKYRETSRGGLAVKVQCD